MDSFSDMRIFVAVVQARHFRKGAESLGLPASTVSRRISRLEQRLGIRLLNRSTRALALTEAGQIYYGRCRRLVTEVELAEEELLSESQQARGTLRMSLPVDFAQRFLAPIIAAFAEAHPGLRFQLDLSARQVSLIEEPFDLVVRIGAVPDSGLICRRVADLQVGMYAAAGYDGAEKIALSASPDARYQVNSVGMLVRLAEAGCGIAVLPHALVQEELRRGSLMRIQSDQSFPAIPVNVLTETRLLPARTRLFIEYLITHMPRPPQDGSRPD